ncbi:MAG: heavy-metal-associated domain-containing protein [Anaerolineae bacterium]|nr:heavy-metal-associated domain-containing protein [Anaerolineae bacterium]MDW8172324.1 heavy metal-associated domain-containing protein [Anaerolineae bacterium]
MQTKTFRVPNIGCGGCVRTIESELGQMSGIAQVRGEVASKQVTVVYDAPATWEAIVAKLKELDYPPTE